MKINPYINLSIHHPSMHTLTTFSTIAQTSPENEYYKITPPRTWKWYWKSVVSSSAQWRCGSVYPPLRCLDHQQCLYGQQYSTPITDDLLPASMRSWPPIKMVPYTAQRGELTKLIDKDGDGRADVYRDHRFTNISGYYQYIPLVPKVFPDGSMMVTGNVALATRNGGVVKAADRTEAGPLKSMTRAR